MQTTKITRLTPKMASAVQRAVDLGFLSDGVVLTKTTATFPGKAKVAHAAVDRAIAEMDALDFHSYFRPHIFLVWHRLYNKKRNEEES